MNVIEKLESDKAFMYWFLGWMYTDGNVTSSERYHMITIDLHERDSDIIYKIKEFLDVGSICKLVKKSQLRLTITKKELYYWLISHGVVPRKGSSDIYPVDIPDEYKMHFIRGAFEGDGSIWKGNGKNSSSLMFIIAGKNKGFIDYISSSLGIKAYYREDKNLYYVMSHSSYQIMEIYEALYKDCGNWYGLRKKEKFVLYSEERSSKQTRNRRTKEWQLPH